MIFWYWMILGGLFLIIEIATFTTFFLFFCISAFIMGFLTFIYPGLSLNLQLLIAAILAVISCIAFYNVYKKRKSANSKNINQNRLHKFLNCKLVLTEDVTNGVSKVSLGDTQWRVEVPYGKKGDTVLVYNYKSTSLIAKNISSQNNPQ